MSPLQHLRFQFYRECQVYANIKFEFDFFKKTFNLIPIFNIPNQIVLKLTLT